MKKLNVEDLQKVVGGFHLTLKENHLKSGQTMLRLLLGEGELDGLVLAGGQHFDDSNISECDEFVFPDFVEPA